MWASPVTPAISTFCYQACWYTVFMSEFAQFTAENYPDESSEIVTDAFGFGFLNALFEDAVTQFGNDESVRWPSYSEDDVEFKVNYAGQGTVIQEGTTWPVWLLQLARANETEILKVDIATCSTERWTDEGFVPGGFKGNSDLIAAALNLQQFSNDRLDEGDSELAIFRRAYKSNIQALEIEPTEDK
jgi:hypothetical protein